MEQEAELRRDQDGEADAGSVTPLEIFAFLRGAAGRHRTLGLICGTSLAIIGIATVLILPPRYETESRILAMQSAAVAAALSNPVRPLGNNGNMDPFAGSTEILRQKSNLIWLVEHTGLVAAWEANRTFPFNLKDKLVASLWGPPKAEQLVSGLADTLEQRMFVSHDPSVLTIHLIWRDPLSALKLTQLATSRFLELTREQELKGINAAISVNEDEVKRAGDGIDQALEEVNRIRTQKREALQNRSTRGAAAGSVVSGGLKVAEQTGTAAVVADKKLAAKLTEIRQQERDLEAPWQRRLAELKFQLSDLRATYGPEHPLVRQQEIKISDATQPPLELTMLRQKEKQLLSEIEKETATIDARANSDTAVKSGSRAVSARASTSSTSVANGEPRTARLISSDGALVIAERDEDPTISPERAGLTAAIRRYTEVCGRLESARLELASAQVALQLRFAVVAEPELPKRPTKPNRPLLIAVVIAAASLLGFFIGGVKDLLSGKLFEPWQIRILGLEVIGELVLDKKK